MSTPARTGVAAVGRTRVSARDSPIPVAARPVVAITALAAVLRFVLIAHQSWWFDEAQAVHGAQSSFSAMLHLWSGYEPNPPLYFVVAWVWGHVFGTGEIGLRSLSAVLGTATIPFLYLAGSELVSRRAGQVAALLAAVNPFLIGYSQEAREYALLAFLSAISLWLFARARRTGAAQDVAAWAVAGALTLATAYFGGLLVAAEAIALLVVAWRREDRRLALETVVGCVLVAIVLGLLVPHLAGHADKPGQWIASGGSLSLRARQVPVTFALDTMFRGPAMSDSLIGGAIAVIVFVALLLVGATDRQLRAAGVCALLAAVVLLVPLALAAVSSRHDYYEPRALIGAWLPLAVIAGAACAAPRARVAGAVVAAVLVAGFLYGDAVIAWGNPTYRKTDFKRVAQALGAASGTRAIVANDGDFATAPLALYLPGVAWTGPGQDPQPAGDPATATVSELDFVGNSYQAPLRRLPQGVRLIADRELPDGLRVLRFALASPRAVTRLTAQQLAGTLVEGGGGQDGTLFQSGPS